MTRNLGISLAILAAIISMSAAQAQDTLVLSPRVGKVIDRQECRYFGLFPAVSEPVSIEFNHKGNGLIDIKNNGVTFIVIESAVFQMIGSYIEDFDSLRYHLRDHLDVTDVHEQYEQLIRHDIINPLSEERGDQVSVHYNNVDGTPIVVEGELLWVDDRVLLLRPESTDISTEPLDISAADVAQICQHSSATAKGLYAGMFFGAIYGFAYTFVMDERYPGKFRELPLPHVVFAIAYAAVGAAAGGIIGYLLSDDDCRDINGPQSLEQAILELKVNMYYRYGLPPDSPWRGR